MSSSFSLFCLYADDVRQEANGKQIIVGLYQGGMNVAGALPVTLPQLFVLGHLIVPPTIERIEHLRFTAEYAGKMLIDVEPPIDLLRSNLEKKRENDLGDSLVLQLSVGLQPFVIDQPGKLTVKAVINGSMEVDGNSLTIRQAPANAPSET